MGKLWSMYNVDTQCTVWGEREGQRAEKKILFNFFLSCHKIWILFYSYFPFLTSCIFLLSPFIFWLNKLVVCYFVKFFKILITEFSFIHYVYFSILFINFFFIFILFIFFLSLCLLRSFSSIFLELGMYVFYYHSFIFTDKRI